LVVFTLETFAWFAGQASFEELMLGGQFAFLAKLRIQLAGNPPAANFWIKTTACFSLAKIFTNLINFPIITLSHL
jgi:hypothetical protein